MLITYQSYDATSLGSAGYSGSWSIRAAVPPDTHRQVSVDLIAELLYVSNKYVKRSLLISVHL